jgi:hypothetical protein
MRRPKNSLAEKAAMGKVVEPKGKPHDQQHEKNTKLL